jgi:hypothetical protein
MASRLKKMQIIQSIIQLVLGKRSQYSIADDLNISLGTVRNYLARFKASIYPLNELLTVDDVTLAEIAYPCAVMVCMIIPVRILSQPVENGTKYAAYKG